MALTEALTAGVRTYPERRHRGYAKSNNLAEVHHSRSTKNGEHMIIEVGARRNVGTLD